MLTCSLQSGSNGNCIYVETEDTRLLFDAGISGSTAQLRLEQNGRDIRDVQALIISHNHTDHVRSAGVFQRKFRLPIYITHGSWQASKSGMGQVDQVTCFAGGEVLQFGNTRVTTIPTPHDGREGVAFVIQHKKEKLGIFTDLGHRFAGIEEWICDLDGLYLESNYDPQMLAEGPYPLWLQRRISGAGGHISNGEAAQMIRDCGSRIKLVILSHLSEHNNHPNIAQQTFQEIVSESFPIRVASRYEHSTMFEIE